jgi:peptidoglycan/xylan/chitin deacetylase (PgdA/CDA1 family)
MKVVSFILLIAVVSGPGGTRIVSSGGSRSHEVALTFDAGADRGFAGRILTTLERNHVRATFGMTGLWAEQNPDLVKRMARDGDTFINHTYDHRSFTGLSTQSMPLTRAQRVWEITRAEQTIKRISGRNARPYFRPPFGDYDPATLSLLHQMGYRYMVMWTVDSLGWQHASVQAIVQRCLDDAQPGAIYLMHVGSQSQDGVALPTVIRLLERRHYTFVTVPVLLRSS